MRLSTANIQFSYGSKKILDDLSFSSDGRKFIGVIGPNGSGKTTFLKLLYRVLKPQNGVVYLDLNNIETLSLKSTAKEMAVVSQHNYYEFDFSVLEIVLMGRSPRKKLMDYDNEADYQIAKESLKKVDMLDFSHRNFNSLSGGEQQRVILARALTQEPNILILDEPTNHLDVKYQLELLNTVKGLDVEVIAALHDLNLAATFCDEIVALHHGKIYAQGSPKEVFTVSTIRTLYDVNANIFETGKDQFQIVYTL